MTLNNILDNIQYGKEYTKEKILREGIEKCYDEELDIFYASTRIKDLSGNIVMDESEEANVNTICSKVQALETRLEKSNPMSEAYRKMQGFAIVESCEHFIDNITKSRKIDTRKAECFGKMIAATEYFVESYIDCKAIFKESSNPLLNKIIKDELKGIESIL